MMYSEILAAGLETFEDEATASTIGYAKNPTDGWTPAGTWVSYLSESATKK